MSAKKDLSGKKFGMLTAIKDSGVRTKKLAVVWECACDCGNICYVESSLLINGHTRSCGCLLSRILKDRNTKHGYSKTRLHSIWCHMKQRCLNSNDDRFKYYGGKGIIIHPDWMNFDGFMEWALSSGYNSNLTIDRKDSNKNYEPSNCHWLTGGENASKAMLERWHSEREDGKRRRRSHRTVYKRCESLE